MGSLRDLSIYVVTGGAGFIGSHLATRIGQAGHAVRVLDSLTGSASRERARDLASVPHVEIIEGDIRDPDVCRRALEGADYRAPPRGRGLRAALH